MRISNRLNLIVAISVLAFGVLMSLAEAGVDPGLCHSMAARADIPSGFAVNACFDGSHLAVEDSINYVLEVATTGDVGNPQRKESDVGLAADAERLHANGDPGIFLPGDELIFPVGSGAGTVALTHGPDNGFYAIATTIAAFFPGKPAAFVGAFTGLVAELNDDYAEYANCIIGKDWLGQLGCQARRSWNVTYAVGRAVVNGTASDIVAAVLAPTEWAKWVDATVQQAKPLISAAKVIKIAAAPTAPKPQPATTVQAQPTRTETTTTSTSTTSGSFAVGSSFSSMCVVAWPTAPTITSNAIQMTMSCYAVPETEYLLTVVTFDDPKLPICADHRRAYVVGAVRGVATSEYGFKELLVQASDVKVQGQCES